VDGARVRRTQPAVPVRTSTYYNPHGGRRDLQVRMEGTQVLEDLRRELRAYHDGNGQFGHETFALARR